MGDGERVGQLLVLHLLRACAIGAYFKTVSRGLEVV